MTEQQRRARRHRVNGYIDLFTAYAAISIAAMLESRIFERSFPLWTLVWFALAMSCVAIVIAARMQRRHLARV